MLFGRIACAGLIGAAAFWAAPSEATTFQAFVSVTAGPDRAFDLGARAASATAQFVDNSDPSIGAWSDTTVATASGGGLSAKVVSDSPSYMGTAFAGYGGTAITSFVDRLYFSGAAAYARLTFSYEGAFSVSSGAKAGFSAVTLDVFGGGDFAQPVYALYLEDGATAQAFAGTGELLVQVVGGEADVGGSLELVAEGCGGTLTAGATGCETVLDFSKGLTFTGGEILDSSFAVVHGAAATSASGFDYFGSAGSVSAVPVPAGVWLMALAFGTLGAVRHSKRTSR